MKIEQTNNRQLAYSIKQAAYLTSLGKTRIYELVREGKLVKRRVGRRSLITAESLHALIEGEV
ncbi:helix-turn-helix domain-containing protein [Altererythrobacter sp. GH1-8]|uniref:helix-turn-helix domain-containing protein n=1 Tax=Altererythrobacter sp. GH1-8 TaxID=3349333 RepID=UPI00374D80EF